MHRNISLFFLGIFKQRKFRNPEKCKFVFINQSKGLSEFTAKRTKHGIYRVTFPGNHTDEISCLCSRKCNNLGNFLRSKNFGYGRTDFIVLSDRNPRHAATTLRLNKFRKMIDLFSCKMSSRRRNCSYSSPFFDCICKNSERTACGKV